MQNKRVFVFSSNVEGRHTTGTALRAYEDHGAVYGEGYGLQGSSFAIPVKDENFKFLPLNKIKSYVDRCFDIKTHNLVWHPAFLLI